MRGTLHTQQQDKQLRRVLPPGATGNSGREKTCKTRKSPKISFAGSTQAVSQITGSELSGTISKKTGGCSKVTDAHQELDSVSSETMALGKLVCLTEE